MSWAYWSLRRDDPLVSMANSVGVDLPSPLNMSFSWNFGSLLLFFLGGQIVTGILLATNYVAGMDLAFQMMDSLGRDVWWGWLTRYLHIAGSSAFFFFIYLHIGRGVYYGSYFMVKTWLSGVSILLISMASAFLGYVLPWGQMSYWGASVITNFFSVVPYIGKELVIWLWGSFSVDYPTLSRFFALHFLVPLILLALVGVHILFLHETGSNNPLGVGSNSDKMIFFPYFLSKDFLGWFSGVGIYVGLFFGFPWMFMEYQNFMQANSLVTPPHIQPEWYFLAAYAVLRAIPKKLGGVLALLLFIVVLYFLPLFTSTRVRSFSAFRQVMFWFWVVNFILLTWIGACPVEDPFILLSRIGCLGYFLFFFSLNENL